MKSNLNGIKGVVQNHNNSNVNSIKMYNSFHSQNGQLYDKSRMQCTNQMNNFKTLFQKERGQMAAHRQKEMFLSVQKFQKEYDQLYKQILHTVNSVLIETKARFLAQIQKAQSLQTRDEVLIKKDIDQQLQILNNFINGLKKDDQYKEYIAKIVLTDFKPKLKLVRDNILKIKYPNPILSTQQKYYNCFRIDLQKIINLNINSIRDDPYKAPMGFEPKLHQNRDAIKNKFG